MFFQSARGSRLNAHHGRRSAGVLRHSTRSRPLSTISSIEASVEIVPAAAFVRRWAENLFPLSVFGTVPFRRSGAYLGHGGDCRNGPIWYRRSSPAFDNMTVSVSTGGGRSVLMKAPVVCRFRI